MGDVVVSSSPPPRRHRYPTRYNLYRRLQAKRNGEERSLPIEIMMNILLLMPVDILHRVLRYVCKQWYDIISDPLFIRAHYRLSSASVGQIIQYPGMLRQICYVNEEDVDDDGLFKGTNIRLPFSAKLCGSVNGLVLLRDPRHPHKLHVMNPVTKVKLSLPPAVGLHKYNSSVGFSITSSGHYKVVYIPGDGGVQLRVFTIGVDKTWRSIDVNCLPLEVSNRGLPAFDIPHFIAGFCYWCRSYICFALDVDTETVYWVSMPNNVVRNCIQMFFIRLGSSYSSSLGLLKQGKLWKLIDVKSSKWSEFGTINIKGMRSRLDKMFYPRSLATFIALTLIDGEFWSYHRVEHEQEHIVVRYNLNNESFVYFPIKKVYSFTPYPHVHTLLSPNKCYPGIV